MSWLPSMVRGDMKGRMEAELHQGECEEKPSWVVKSELVSARAIWVRPTVAVAVVWHESPNTHAPREVSPALKMQTRNQVNS